MEVFKLKSEREMEFLVRLIEDIILRDGGALKAISDEVSDEAS